MEEDTLMQRAAEGDVQASGQLVKAHQPRLIRFATRMLGDAERAEDAVQEAFLRLWRARARYQAQGSFACFLLRIVRNACLDQARNALPTACLEEVADSPLPAAEEPAARLQAEALAEAVRRAVQSLPEAQRAVFVLSQYEGLSYQEIAAMLECPVGTVASRKHLAVETLRRRLGPWNEEEIPK
ncbi:MAG TPA: RNA polymerase sigma factor [Chthonomonadaceae bacterium]|nr:RNA polymerase sigma factor [Chthonomonadaceae bacterium]